MNVEIREAKDTEESQIRKLFFECFNKELSYDEWLWKYKKSPWKSASIVALDGENIVAHYGAIKTMFYYKGKTFTVYQPCDVMTHPKYRAKFFSHKGLMVKTAEYFFSNYEMDFAYGFPSERHALLGTKKLNYTPYRHVSVLSKDHKKCNYSRNILYKVSQSWEDIKISEIAKLWDNIKEEQKLTILKKSDYLLWRYKEHPTKQYLPLVVRSRFTKALKALCIYRINDNQLLVSDCLCKEELFLVLLRILESILLEKKLSSLSIWLNPSEETYYKLLKNGYNENKGVPLLFKILNQRLSPEFLFENYRYTMGDYDAG
ncbi:MAG: GNAT family N-acetyltransferase [Thermodesulfovibrionales bacterium]|nr:GNAT family N-acetyltransferase [Thermodesulfovibrionales bacterium]